MTCDKKNCRCQSPLSSAKELEQRLDAWFADLRASYSRSMWMIELLFPDCEILTDNHGQIVIYTGKVQDGNNLVDFELEEDE